MSFEQGQRYRLLRTHGNTEPGAYNNPVVPLKADSIGTVREVVPADVKGAHDNREDAVVLEFEHREAALDEDGEAVLVRGRRAVAFGFADFEGPDALFEEVTE